MSQEVAAQVAAEEAAVVERVVEDHPQAEAEVLVGAAVVAALTLKRQAGTSQAAHELAKNT